MKNYSDNKGNLFIVFMPFQLFVAQQIIRQEGLKHCILIEGYRNLFEKQYDMMCINEMWCKRVVWEKIAQADAPHIQSLKELKWEYGNYKRLKSILEENNIDTIHLGEMQNQAMRLFAVLFNIKGYKIAFFEEGSSHYATLPYTNHNSWKDKLKIYLYDWLYYKPVYGARFGKWRVNTYCPHTGLPIDRRYSIIPHFHEHFDVQLKVEPLFSSQLEKYIRQCVDDSNERRVVLMTDPFRELITAEYLHLYFDVIKECFNRIDDDVAIYIKFHPRDNDDERKQVIEIANNSGKKYKVLSEEVNVSIEYFLQMFRFEKIFFFNASTYFYNGYAFPKIEFETLLPALYEKCVEIGVPNLERMKRLYGLVKNDNSLLNGKGAYSKLPYSSQFQQPKKHIGGGKKFLIKAANGLLCRFKRFSWYIKRERLKMSLGSFGDGFSIDRDWKIPFPENIYIGNDVSLGERTRLSTSDSRIIIKDHVMFGPEVSVHGGDHRFDIVGRTIKSIDRDEKRPGIDDKDVVIEEDVWVGQGAVILMGVTVGRGCVIGAGSIISKDTVPYGIYVGVNKLVGMRFTPEQIKEHERILYGR